MSFFQGIGGLWSFFEVVIEKSAFVSIRANKIIVKYNWHVSHTSRAIWAARLRRLKAAFSDTKSPSPVETEHLVRSPIAFTASAAGKNQQPHHHNREYAENVACSYVLIVSLVTSLHIVLLHCNLVHTELSENVVWITSLCFFYCFFGLMSTFFLDMQTQGTF